MKNLMHIESTHTHTHSYLDRQILNTTANKMVPVNWCSDTPRPNTGSVGQERGGNLLLGLLPEEAVIGAPVVVMRDCGLSESRGHN